MNVINFQFTVKVANVDATYKNIHVRVFHAS